MELGAHARGYSGIKVAYDILVESASGEFPDGDSRFAHVLSREKVMRIDGTLELET